LKYFGYNNKNNIFIFIIMENSNNISKSLSGTASSSSNGDLGSVTSILSSSGTASTASSSDSSFFSYFQNITATTWIMIIVILAFLGFNVFAVLAKGTQNITTIFQPLIDLFARLTGQVVSVSAEGAKGVVSTSAGVVDTGLTGVQDVAQGQSPLNNQQGINQGPNLPPSPSPASTSTSSVPVQSTISQPESSQNYGINKVLNAAAPQSQGSNGQTYEADTASSSIQSGGLGKAGWCYIGDDDGYRTCAQVGVNDKCMSGDIFPSQDICINPNLRS
jgi:hypothetical protein